MQPIGRERANRAEQAQDKDSEEYSLMRIPVSISTYMAERLKATYGVKVGSPWSKVCITAVARTI